MMIFLMLVNTVPELAGLGRVIAPDLIGHGDSDKGQPRWAISPGSR